MRTIRRSRLVGLAYGAVLACGFASAASAWSFTFPAAYCVTMPGSAPVGVNIGALVPGSPDKFGWSFAPLAAASPPRQIACDVEFPSTVTSPNFTVTLTWQSADIDTGTPPQVCWRSMWEITRPGQAWASNTGSAAAPADLSASVVATANVDIHSAIGITAYDDTSVLCPTGASPNTCAGSHGLLILQRLPTEGCPADSNQAGVVSRIRLDGTP